MALNLSLRPEVEEIARAAEWLHASGETLGVPPDQIRRLDQCLDELLANVVHHGGAQAAASEVRLRLAVADAGAQREATLSVDDGGPPFNPLEHKPRPIDLELDELEPGGLGILMVREFSDRLAYRYQQGRNVLDVTVAWPAGAPSS